MELKEGMYVRYIPTLGEYTQNISKITKTKNCLLDMAYTLDDEEEVFSSHFDEILKASYNIIDLIEVGDYVNGCKVTRILGTLYDKNDLHCYCDETWNKDKKCLLMIPANEIKSIVTKEQFEAMKYEIK